MRYGLKQPDPSKRDDDLKPLTLWCWQFFHPRFHWVGGTEDDNWSPNKAAIESNMKHCEWPTKLLTKSG